jgi:branched-chain amino acid transport system ATP-binding protein
VLFRGDDVTALARAAGAASRAFRSPASSPSFRAGERADGRAKAGGSFRLVGAPSSTLAAGALQASSSSGSSTGPAGASTLPHGDQRLLEIAMAVAQEPELLLLDEPTQGLAPDDTAATVAVIRQVARERKLTIILVEHDMDVVFDLADRISVLHFGRLIAEGTPAEIRANAEVQTAYLGGLD